MTIVELYYVLTLGFTTICGAGVGAYFYGPLGLLGGAVAGFVAYVVAYFVLTLAVAVVKQVWDCLNRR